MHIEAEVLERQLPPRERAWLKWLRRAGLLLLALYFAFGLALLALRYLVVPHIADYREDIAQAVSGALGERVTIDRIIADWYGLHPRLQLDGVKIHDPAGGDGLTLPQVNVVVAWRSLLYGELRFRSLVLDRPDLRIRRAPDGMLFIAGMPMQGGSSDDAGLGDWMLKHAEIQIRDATIEWEDQQRGAAPLRLQHLEFLLRNDGGKHRFALRGEPQREYGSALDVRGELAGRSVAELQSWTGRLYANFDHVDLAAWQAWVDYPFEVQGGRGALRVWLGFARAKLTELAADVALDDVAARFGPGLPLLQMQSMRGRLGAKETRQGFGIVDRDTPDVAYEAFARQLALVTGNGIALEPSDFTARWEPADRKEPEKGEFKSGAIDLAPLGMLGEYLPLPDTLRKTIAATAPQGVLSEVLFTWSGPIERPQSYAARGRFANVGMQPYQDLPGFAQLSGNFEVTDKGGRVFIEADKTAIEYPDVFADKTIALDTLAARVAWSFPDGNLDLRLEDVAVQNADMAMALTGSYRTGPPGVRGIDVTMRAPRAHGPAIYKYIPHLPAEVAEWLRMAIVAGAASDVRLRLRGDLDDFPFRDARKGEFKISGRVTNAQLAYAPDWPKIDDIAGELVFDGPRLRIGVSRGAVFGTRLTGVVAQFPDLYGDHAVLHVDGQAEGATAEFLEFIAQSPVHGFLDGLTDKWTAAGAGKLALKLELPLDALERSKVSGSYQFAGNTLVMGPGEGPITQVNGKVDFTETGAASRGITAQYLGGPLAIQIDNRGEQGIIASGQGSADSAALLRSIGVPIADRVRGTLPYRFTSTARKQRNASTFESTLQGVAIDLPAPFGKAAADSWPLRIERTPAAETTGQAAQRENITLTLGSLLNARAMLRTEDDRTTIERAGVAIGDAALPRPEGANVAVAANLKTLDLDSLLPLLAWDAEKGSMAPMSAFSLRTGELTAAGRLFHDVTLRARLGSGSWSADVAARELAGEVSWRPEEGGLVRARLKHLVHPESAPGERAEMRALKELPGLDIVAERYTLHGHELGKLELKAANEQRGWLIERAALTAPEGVATVRGLWQGAASGPERTELDFKLEVSDVGKYLERLGYAETVAQGKGELEGRVSWAGPPTSLDYSTLLGNVAVRAEKGQFIKVKPGIGKLLGVLSLQSLPRRITLDFKDVFSEGFAFDRIEGNAMIARGVMVTTDLAMVGPSASVVTTGSVDLQKETQDLTVRVVPTVGDSVAAAAGLALLNPIIGVGALLAQRLLKDPIGQMLAFEYVITGGWDDPKVEKVRGPQPDMDGGGAEVNGAAK